MSMNRKRSVKYGVFNVDATNKWSTEDWRKLDNQQGEKQKSRTQLESVPYWSKTLGHSSFWINYRKSVKEFSNEDVPQTPGRAHVVILLKEKTK